MKNFILSIAILIVCLNMSAFSMPAIEQSVKVGNSALEGAFLDVTLLNLQQPITQKVKFEGSLQAGFVGDLRSAFGFRHALNRVDVKFVYCPNAHWSLFVEGNFVAPMANVPVNTYYTYSSYQAIGATYKY